MSASDQPFSIVGILNITPDSFYDGGRCSVDDALERVHQMMEEGVDMVEVGGEAYGPGSVTISAQEEGRRVLPVIRAIHQAHPALSVSCDTCKAVIAAQAIAAGATMINDTSAGRCDPAMFALLAEHPAVQLVLMYSKDIGPHTTREQRAYRDVISEISAFLEERIDAAVRAGIAQSRLIVDPGLGWYVSGDPAYSFAVLAGLRKFLPLGSPILVSPSRKSFLAGAEQLPPAERLPGTIAASAIAVLHGAEFIRTHDVLPVRRACTVAAAIAKSQTVHH